MNQSSVLTLQASRLPAVNGADLASLRDRQMKLESALQDMDRQLTALADEAKKLLDSKQRLEAERSRLVNQRDANRAAIRHLEDRE